MNSSELKEHCRYVGDQCNSDPSIRAVTSVSDDAVKVRLLNFFRIDMTSDEAIYQTIHEAQREISKTFEAIQRIAKDRKMTKKECRIEIMRQVLNDLNKTGNLGIVPTYLENELDVKTIRVQHRLETLAVNEDLWKEGD